MKIYKLEYYDTYEGVLKSAEFVMRADHEQSLAGRDKVIAAMQMRIHELERTIDRMDA